MLTAFFLIKLQTYKQMKNFAFLHFYYLYCFRLTFQLAFYNCSRVYNQEQLKTALIKWIEIIVNHQLSNGAKIFYTMVFILKAHLINIFIIQMYPVSVWQMSGCLPRKFPVQFTLTSHIYSSSATAGSCFLAKHQMTGLHSKWLAGEHSRTFNSCSQIIVISIKSWRDKNRAKREWIETLY